MGSNGCGKTTIIESLKYAVCGAMPPGNKSGQAFVHDPKSIGHSTVKANIKVRFTNRAGSSMVVVRSMEVQQKKTTLTFKQLDGVLRTIDEQGNRQSLSHKCTELDKQIPILLGVSKAILEHVVFCHQEDASWPLQEGAVLKRRFDDIFDSTRYSKALEVLAKEKKHYQGVVKDLKADLSGLASHKHAAKGFRQEIARYQEQMETLEEERSDANKAIQELDEERQRIQKIMEQMEDMNTKLELLRNDRTQLQAVIKKQTSMLQQDLTQKHSLRELKEMYHSFDTEMEQQLERKRDLEADMRRRQDELQRLRTEERELQSRLGRLQAEQEAQDKRLRLRYDKMIEIGQTYGLGDILTPISQTQPSQTQNTSYMATSLGDTSAASTTGGHPNQPILLDIPQDDMDSFYRALSRKEDELKEALTFHRQKSQQLLDQLQATITDLNAKQISIENDRAKLNKQQAEARNELKSINSQIPTTSRLRKSDVEEAKRAAAKFAKERDEVNADPRRTEIPTEIRSLEEKIDKLKRDIEDDQIALRDLRHCAEAQNAIVVLREQSTKDLEALQESLQEQSFVLQKFNMASPQDLPGAHGGDDAGDELTHVIDTLVDQVSSKYESANFELSKATEDMNQVQRVVSEKSALLSHDQQSLASKKARLTQLEAKNGSIDKVRRVVEELRQYETNNGISTTHQTLDESKPEELMSYLESRLEEVDAESTDGIQPQLIKKVITRLKKQVRRASKVTSRENMS